MPKILQLDLYDRIKLGLLRVPRVGAPILWRFWRNIAKDGPEHPYDQTLGNCWRWLRAKTPAGYGVFNVDGSLQYAHIYSYKLYTKQQTDGFTVCHNCDNPQCSNPHHLFVGRQPDNVADCVAKGRHARGEKMGSAKLTEAFVRMARKRYVYRCSINGAAAMAREAGVTTATMMEAISGVTWKHLIEIPKASDIHSIDTTLLFS